MKREWTFNVDKAKSWGPGAWADEPDKVLWTDEVTGLFCMVRRNMQLGQWCGYVAVPEGHQDFGKGYEDAPYDCHGGLTYADRCFGEPEVWWFGFDCGHSYDLSPGLQLPGLSILPGERYRDLAYVQREVTELAAQIKERA